MHPIDEYMRDRYEGECEEDLTEKDIELLTKQYGENWREILNINCKTNKRN